MNSKDQKRWEELQEKRVNSSLDEREERELLELQQKNAVAQQRDGQKGSDTQPKNAETQPNHEASEAHRKDEHGVSQADRNRQEPKGLNQPHDNAERKDTPKNALEDIPGQKPRGVK